MRDIVVCVCVYVYVCVCVCVCVIFVLMLQIICHTGIYIDVEWIFLKVLSKYKWHVQYIIRNNEKIDQNLYYIS